MPSNRVTASRSNASINRRRGERVSSRTWERFLGRLPLIVVAACMCVSLPIGYHLWSDQEAIDVPNGIARSEQSGLNNERGTNNVALSRHISAHTDGETEKHWPKATTPGLRSASRMENPLVGTNDKSNRSERAVKFQMAAAAKDLSTAAALASRGGGRPSRFPRYGTSEFEDKCGWVLEAAKHHPPSNCTFFYAPSEVEHEGLSFWAAQVVSSHLLALQAGCSLVFNYGPQVDMDQVLIKHPILTMGSSSLDAKHNNWTAERCEKDSSCFEIAHPKGTDIINLGNTLTFNMTGHGTLAPVPRYRYTYSRNKFQRNENVTGDLELTLPGFDIEHGMACSSGALFQLAPNASSFEPGILTQILPALRDEEALVIGVYIRTDWADMSRTMSKSLIARNNGYVAPNGTVLPKGTRLFRERAQPDLNTALAMERKYLAREVEPERSFSKIVWMVSTDTPYLKEWIVESYDGKDANSDVPKKGKKFPSAKIPRHVIVTGSQGRHTRVSEVPSTTVFAEACIDWILLGESDLVITRKYSFAETAALRTSRPVYKNGILNPFFSPK